MLAGETCRQFMKQAFFTLCPLCQARHFVSKYELKTVKVFQCVRCAMIFLNPYTPSSEMAAVYSDSESMEHANSRLAHYYDWLEGSETEKFYDGCLERLSRLFSPATERSLLDVGCGNGHFLSRAKQKGWIVTGIEPSLSSSRLARENYEINVVTTDFESYHGSESFDCVSLWDFIEHVSNPAEVLVKVRSLLKPGGIVLIATPDNYSLINFLADVIYQTSLHAIERPLQILFVPEHILYFTDATLKELVERSGFVMLDKVKAGTDINRYNIGWVFSVTAKALLALSSWLRWENRILVFGRKTGIEVSRG